MPTTPPDQHLTEWSAEELAQDPTWIYPMPDGAGQQLLDCVRAAYQPGKPLLDYQKSDFPFLHATLAVLSGAFEQVREGRGIALVKGLPREGVSAQEFELLTWAIGLHFGVARPQSKASQYLSEVMNKGTDYRSATGRGYSSNAELDFHTDGADVVALTCYNQAISGGESICSSSSLAFKIMSEERPDLVEELCRPYPFSRQGEEAPGEAAFIHGPIFAFQNGRFFCRWVRNRLESARKMEQVPELSKRQLEAVDYLDEVVRRETLMYRMYLEPGDMQLLNTHVTLHSRTQFIDAEEMDKRRLLYRLWIAPPNSPPLPETWRDFYKNVEGGAVRGGILGQHYDEQCQRFDARQASVMGMTL
ncbi:TauD/TfdA family dioxygenase [Alloalcanivorax xenomutans]|uniref:TauD/TfdA family dioxygenase n=1 Tax=Alloalcanivorax xenomutans TaxID=1094342 RepID=UPI0029318C53|nr:TauD/TfdA family dioxygenase [Alloalcanivorax xenomutans]WOA32172.1 TauD/TfdA family dioxygenase [Alloalcanivorax xenomutans]